MWLALFVVALLASPVVLVALLANRAQRGGVASAPGGAAPGVALFDASIRAPRPPIMLRAASPLRLACIRVLLTALALAFPAAFLATGRSGLQPGHVAWFVLSAHAGLGVAIASWIERRAACGDRTPQGAALLAGAAALLTGTVGCLQAEYAGRANEGGVEAALVALQQVLLWAIEHPADSGLALVLVLLGVNAAWALPLALITWSRARPPVPAWLLLAGAVVTAGLAIPAYFVVSLLYDVAEALDLMIGGEAPAAAQ